MKIFCYYKKDAIFSYQEKIIDLWKLSWKLSGFDPVVLGEEDAKRHPFYETFVEKIKSIHYLIKNKRNITEYGLNCFVRWLAYANQKSERFLVSDYDIINFGFTRNNFGEKLNFMNGYCPCLVSGTPKQFENLANSFIIETKKNFKDIKNNTYVKSIEHYHDQEFFVSNFNDTFFKTYDAEMSLEYDFEPTFPQLNENKLIHFSHGYIHSFMLNGFPYTNIESEYPTERHRIELIEFFFKKYISL